MRTWLLGIVLSSNCSLTFADNFALQYKGTKQGASVKNPMTGNPQRFTVEAWVQPGSPVLHSYVYLHREAYRDRFLWIRVDEAGHLKLGLQIREQPDPFNGMVTKNAAAMTSFKPGEWIHIAASYDGTDMRVFVNAKESAKEYAPELDGHLDWNTQWLGSFIGTNLREDEPPYHRGAIDELRIWSVAKTEADIAAGMTKHAEGTEPGLLAAYSFDEGSGQTVHDSSKYHNDGYLGGTPNEDPMDPAWVKSTSPVSYVVIDNIAPQPCPTDGDTLTITGKLFMNPDVTTITLDGSPAGILSFEDAKIVLLAPPHNDAEVPLQIKNSVGTTNAKVIYRSEFIRGDSDRNGTLDIADGIANLAYLFLGGSSDCRDALDVNDDGNLEISDGINLLTFLFLGGIRPPEPFLTKGVDPTPDSLYCER